MWEQHLMWDEDNATKRFDSLWDHRNARLHVSKLASPKQLTWSSREEIGAHAVGPKVDGVRHIVLSERRTGAVLRARSRKLNWHRSRPTRLKSEKKFKDVLRIQVIMVAVTIECSPWVDWRFRGSGGRSVPHASASGG